MTSTNIPTYRNYYVKSGVRPVIALVLNMPRIRHEDGNKTRVTEDTYTRSELLQAIEDAPENDADLPLMRRALSALAAARRPHPAAAGPK